jgi:integrase/recombinase XerD
MLKAYRRHLEKCPHSSSAFMKCRCPLWVMGNFDGRFVRRSLDTRSLERAGQLIREIEDGARKIDSISVSDAVKRFVADAVGRELSPATIRKYKHVEKELKSQFGTLALTAVTVDDIRKLRESWTMSGMTKHKRLEHIKSFFNFCVDGGWIEKSPAKGVKAAPTKPIPTLPFSEVEWKQILWAIDTYPEIHPQSPAIVQKKLRAVILLMRYSGLRISDAVSLKRDRISDAGRLFLYTQKTGKPVHIKLPEMVLKAIDAADDGDLFWNFRGTLKSRLTEWQERLKKIAAIAGVQGRGFAHRLRDSFAVDLFNHGVSIENVAVFLGNTPAVVARHYNPFVESRQAALDKAVEMIWQ